MFKAFPIPCNSRNRFGSKPYYIDNQNIDGDEPYVYHSSDVIQLQHTNFINFLDRCLEFHQKYKHLDKFRLRMKLHSVEGNKKVRECLCFAVGRRVKELDISLEYTYQAHDYCLASTLLNAKPIVILNLENLTIASNGEPISLPSLKTLSLRKVRLEPSSLTALISGSPYIQYLSLTSYQYYYPSYELFMQTRLDAKAITTLNLKGVRILGDNNNNNDPKALGHPSLKTMFLEGVDMDSRIFHGLTSRSPCLEHLSVSLCSGFDGSSTTLCISRSSSLKSIDISTKWNSKAVQVSGAKNLESFTLDSFYSMQFESIRLYGCKNLKYLNIDAPDLTDFALHGCNDSVKATLHVPNVDCTQCTDDPVKATLHVPNLDCVRCTVFLTWGPFSTLTDYLEKFDCFEELSLNVEDVEAFIFPKQLRRTWPPPLPNVKTLNVIINSEKGAKHCDLRHSLFWLAPCAEFLSMKYTDIPSEYKYRRKVL